MFVHHTVISASVIAGPDSGVRVYEARAHKTCTPVLHDIGVSGDGGIEILCATMKSGGGTCRCSRASTGIWSTSEDNRRCPRMWRSVRGSASTTRVTSSGRAGAIARPDGIPSAAHRFASVQWLRRK
jgi:hypothetical protein